MTPENSGDDEALRGRLEALYAQYNHRHFVSPDPLQFLYEYEEPLDREIVGIIAASLAFGNRKQIIKSVERVVCMITEASAVRPAKALPAMSPERLWRAVRGFRHRFASDKDLHEFLLGVQGVLRRHGSLRACFARHYEDSHASTLEALGPFVGELRAEACQPRNALVPNPELGGACKRLHLFLRWMVRRDDVDPGGWDEIPPSKLLVPMDTHMHRIARDLGWTSRRQADAKAAQEATDACRRLAPDDPVRYDFVLTRIGMWKDTASLETLRGTGGRGSHG